MEAINSENFTHGAVHWYGESYGGQGDAERNSSGNLPEGYNRTDWHTYGVEWDKNQIKWYVDDKVFFTQNISSSDMDEFKKNQFIIFNLAVGGQWPGYTIDDSAFPSSSTMEVDYVRVYQKTEDITTKYDGPTITVTQDAVKDYTGTWNSFFGNTPEWVVAAGNIEAGNTPEEGFTAKITSVGKINNDSVWGVQSNLENIKYYPGSTYKYSCTITSDRDKKIFVKVADEAEDVLGGSLIDLKAGVPYLFETDVKIPEDYTGTVSLKFGMGKTNGDTIEDNGAVTINVKDISFVTTATIPDPNYVAPKPTTEEKTTTKSEVPTTGKVVNSTSNESSTVKVAKTKVKKASKKKSSKKAKISLKKIKGASGYKVQISTSKTFKKTKKVKVITKYAKKATFTFKSSKIKNKSKLYVRARAYKTVNGKKKYGSWSKKKKVSIKK